MRRQTAQNRAKKSLRFHPSEKSPQIDGFAKPDNFLHLVFRSIIILPPAQVFTMTIFTAKTDHTGMVWSVFLLIF